MAAGGGGAGSTRTLDAPGTWRGRGEAQGRHLAPGGSGRTGGLRADIQGLRAVAVLLVLAFHAGVPALAGGYVGVDVFFVISGFLITGLVLRELRATGRLDLPGFYARRIRRLLPATAVTFVGVTALTVTLVPVTRWAGIAGDLAAGSLYVMNWRLADRSVDYLQEGGAASPLQHFWSLAVEEQFYVVWPVLIVAVAWLARRRGEAGARPSARGLTLGLLAIGVPSLAWSIHLTATEPGPAYFVTTTRLWELVVGALLAVGAERLGRAPARVRRVAGWAGLAAIGVAAVGFGPTTPFPGVAALVPTLGAAAVLWAGGGDGVGRVRLLEPAPLQHVGALSYSLYLWHWPLIVTATAVLGVDGELPVPVAVLVAVVSLGPAWLTYRLVEQPLHHARALAVPWRAAVAGAVCIGVGLACALTVRHLTPRWEPTPVTADMGAGALGAAPASSPAGAPTAAPTVVPAPVAAAQDNPDVYADGCHQDQDSADVVSCVYGDPDSGTVVALVGDSHAAQWQPGLRAVAEERGWRLETYTKSACPFDDTEVWLDDTDQPYASCVDWVADLTQALLADPPDLVVTSSAGHYRAVADGAAMPRAASDRELAEGSADAWSELEAAGSDVAVLIDTPVFGLDVPECVATNAGDLAACSVPRVDAVAASAASVQRMAVEQAPGVDAVDLTDYVCPRAECSPVIGGVLVARDGDHLTATYSRTLAPALDDALEPLVDAEGGPQPTRSRTPAP